MTDAQNKTDPFDMDERLDQLDQKTLKDILQWHLDNNCADLIENQPYDRMSPPSMEKISQTLHETPELQQKVSNSLKSSENSHVNSNGTRGTKKVYSTSEALMESQKLAAQCSSLDELKQAIMDFEGLSVKKTATNIVFSDGNPKAKIMLIGEAPGADEDEAGKPFVGRSGQLLDKVIASVGLDRTSDDPEKSVYISNILNWRPPGNRTPTPQEIEISLPFIERHIALINPDILLLCGSVSGKSILRSKDAISKLRKSFHNYQVPENLVETPKTIQCLATYHPAYLLRSPRQKRLVWADMLLLKTAL
ncbi:MAG: uracil-DNA glycosylase [Pseudomonadota bacterium]